MLWAAFLESKSCTICFFYRRQQHPPSYLKNKLALVALFLMFMLESGTSLRETTTVHVGIIVVGCQHRHQGFAKFDSIAIKIIQILVVPLVLFLRWLNIFFIIKSHQDLTRRMTETWITLLLLMMFKFYLLVGFAYLSITNLYNWNTNIKFVYTLKSRLVLGQYWLRLSV